MTDMTLNMDLESLARLRNRCRDSLLEGRTWPQILEELDAEGFRPVDLQVVLRGMDAWNDEARRLKAAGWPYEDLVMYLSGMLATGPDIAWALLLAGLRAADMLRAVLPLAAGTEFQDAVIQIALSRGDQDEECRRVVTWHVSEGSVG